MKMPELSVAKSTVPPGVVGLASVSVTVTVHVELWFTMIGLSQATTVAVACRGVTINVVLPALAT